ncbi:MAG: putative sulfate exporter family transporter [Steroidobacteraceae bacterium]
MPLRLSTSLAVIACAFFGPWFAQYAGTVLLGNSKSPFSAVMGAILAGMVIGNLWPKLAGDGAVLKSCTVLVLRIGIVLLGLRLSLAAAIGLGFHALPIVLICISSALLLVTVASRAMAMSPQLAALIAVGTSICGVTAIVAMAPVIRAREAEVSYAVGCIALFGLVAMFVHPMIAHALFATEPQLAGVFLGTAVHDTSQVVGAGLMYQDQYSAGGVLEAATVTKLVRNLMMAAVIPLVAVLFQGGARQEQAAATSRRLPAVPGFVLWFIAMCALRSAVDFCEPSFGQLAKNLWISIVGDAQRLSELCLTVSMAAVGLQTRIGAFRQIGFRPLLLAMLTAAVVGGVSLLSIRLILETA